MNIAFFGSSLVSSYWNGAATYYRGILHALHALGHSTTFFEPDAYDRQAHRDIDDPAWARVVVYEPTLDGASRAFDAACAADVIVKASGVGVFDPELEALVASARDGQIRIFWDVDAPATLDRLRRDPADPFHALIPRFDLVLTYGGGEPVCRGYRAAGARTCVPIYNALDPKTHFRVEPDTHFTCDLAFLGNRLPDREERVDEFFFRPAAALPAKRFLLGGSGWHTRAKPANVRELGHVSTAAHNALNSTAAAVLNISRESMARCGYSPATRVFEAAGAGACIITDAWEGIERFLEPDEEILVASSGEAVAALVARLTPADARRIGSAAARRVRADHTYTQRARQVEAVLQGRAVAT